MSIDLESISDGEIGSISDRTTGTFHAVLPSDEKIQRLGQGMV